ncbi:MAG: Gfo/Idh/MocA family oxidoreductase [Candidatus Hydrogenedentes bacterium]|nr:Gfo/Idh/MocA family oxidoreductase [Candidatus Hydrogenedentota bacterium]
MGVRGRGFDHVRAAHSSGQADVVALCDVDQGVLDGRCAELEKLAGAAPRPYRDMRELLADDSIDAVTFATPNHWHVLGAIWAMQAGKHVYVEKPISHTVWEGRQLVAAAKKYKRVAQHGTQRRSEPQWQRYVERLRSGAIGDIYMARCPIYRFRDPFKYPMAEPVPDGLDWGLWQGPAPEKAFSRNYVHYNWHWFWHYGNGEVGNNGPHGTDIVNWVMDKGLPVETYAAGGVFGYEDDARETPNTLVVTHTFADGTTFVIDVRNRHTNGEDGVLFYGSEGYAIGGALYNPKNEVIPDEQEPPERVNSTDVHMASFIQAVKNNDPDAVPATVEQGHIAASLCHLANVSYRTGRAIRFNPRKERVKGDDEANALLTRPYREGFEVPKLA